ncbi:unnamed protein product [Dicrocoelium dendriticum]|nr:unnamed protein product [Dicrocoelium dendriticum]
MLTRPTQPFPRGLTKATRRREHHTVNYGSTKRTPNYLDGSDLSPSGVATCSDAAMISPLLQDGPHYNELVATEPTGLDPVKTVCRPRTHMLPALFAKRISERSHQVLDRLNGYPDITPYEISRTTEYPDKTVSHPEIEKSIFVNTSGHRGLNSRNNHPGCCLTPEHSSSHTFTPTESSRSTTTMLGDKVITSSLNGFQPTLPHVRPSHPLISIPFSQSVPTHQVGVPDEVTHDRWDGSLTRSPPVLPSTTVITSTASTSNPTVVQCNLQRSARPSARTMYSTNQPDGQKHYTRLESLSSVVPLGSVAPITGRLRRESLSTTGGDRNSVADQPGYPMSGDSVTSQQSTVTGSVLTFHHITYEVKLKKMPWSRAVSKTVLNDVSGILRPGLNAIMGPTGSGKSSLLDILAGRKDPRFLSGQVLVDGYPQPKNFKCISGYVVQDDIVMGTLTVRENLNFSAALRMTGRCSRQERRRKVEELIEELGLTSVADSKIGTDLIRGVSGGERKRTNIGMELITDPPVLFLDEPTTGLDAFMAGQVIKTLKNLARRGRTIIFSIHQPKYSIYKLFSSLTLLFRGRIVYHGPAKYEPIRYCLNLGYVCENHNNPPDFFMDILHGEVAQRQSQSRDARERLEEPEHILLVGERLVQEWDQSAECERISKEVTAITNVLQSEAAGTNNHGKISSVPEVSYSVSFWRQMHQVCWRTSINLLRDPLASIVQTLVYLFFALSMGVVYFQMNTSLESGIQNRAGLFFFSTLQVVFVNLGSIELFIKERVLFIHENSSGYYRISAYFLAKILCDILPTKVLPVLLFMPICYWMAGLLPEAAAFFIFELILSVTTLAAAAVALFISASFTLFGIANVIVSILFVFMMVFGGYLINLKSMARWLNWLRYLSIFRYSMGGLLISEMRPLIFCPMTNTSTITHSDSRQW